MFDIVFMLVIGLFIFTFVKNISEWVSNNKSPRLTVDAVIVSKRTHVTHHQHANANGAVHTASSTFYYASFQFESGDRMELNVGRNEYGLLAEGDHGKLTFQGTRYLGFERT